MREAEKGALPAGKTLTFIQLAVQNRGLKRNCWTEGTCRNFEGFLGKKRAFVKGEEGMREIIQVSIAPAA